MTPTLILLAALLGQCDKGNCRFPILGTPPRAVTQFLEAKPLCTAVSEVLKRKPARTLAKQTIRPAQRVRQAGANRPRLVGRTLKAIRGL